MATTEITFRNRVTFLQKVWALSWPFFWSEQRTVARLLLGVIVVMTLAGVGMDVVFNYWYKDFYNSLQTKDEPEFWRQLLKFAVIAVIYILLVVYNQYLQQMLHIRWRKWMTETLLQKWLSNRTYYKLQFSVGGADNPEQRIEQDIHFFAANAIAMPLGLLKAVVTLASFVVILWTISGAISLPLGATEITIPGYMVWVAVIYAAVGSWLTYKIGRPLIATNFGLQKSNATFRYGMTRLRENAESVAFYRGEAMEAQDLRVKFDQVWKYWWDFMRQQKQLSWFLSGYGQIAIIFPILVASPRYFSGAIELGVLMQIASAFGNVQGSLSWFANNFGGDTDSGLAPWKATIDRLTGFVDAMERAEQIETGFDVKPSARPELAVANATLKLPSGKVLVENLSMQIPVGDRLLVSGPSGSGKTTLFRALAGIWPFGSGEIAQPSSGRALFLPQRPYLPIGSLRGALAYPAESGQIETAEARSALADVGLAQLADRLDEESDWSKELSGGEQQRLAIARALISKPDWLYLDEATSALDTENEQRMYRLLAERLPAATVLSIAHRADVGKYHARRLTIDPENRRADISPIAAE